MLFFNLQYLIGFFFLLVFTPKLPRWVIFSCAMPFGIILFTFWEIIFYHITLFSKNYQVYSLQISLLILIVIYGIIKKKLNISIKIIDLAQFLLILSVFSLTIFFTSNFNFSNATNDSYGQIVSGKYLAHSGLLWSSRQTFLSSSGIFLPIILSNELFLNVSYFQTLSPVIAVSLLFCYSSLTYNFLREITNKKNAIFSVILSTILLFRPYIISYYSTYLHVNLMVSLFLFIGTVTSFLYARTKEHQWLFLSFLAFVASALSRVEGPFYSLIFIMLLSINPKIRYKIRLKFTISYVVIITLWYLNIARLIGDYSYILNSSRIFAIIGIHILWIIVMMLLEKLKIPSSIKNNLDRYMLFVFLLTLVFAFLIKPEHMLTSAEHFFTNLYRQGNWSMAWVLITILLVFSIQLKLPSDYRRLITGIICCICFILLLSFLRSSYRLDWTDSGNRMMVHLYPLVIFCITIIYNYFNQQTSKKLNSGVFDTRDNKYKHNIF